MNRSFLSALVVGFSLASISAFSAYEPWLSGPCADDAKKLCAEALATGSKILECMRAHETELSAGCKLKRESRRVEAAGTKGDIKKDCSADIERFCKNQGGPKKLAPGAAPRPARGCLHENLAKLSPACKIHFEGSAARRPPEPASAPTPIPSPTSTPTPAATTASLESESFRFVTRLSPSERTLTLASVATGNIGVVLESEQLPDLDAEEVDEQTLRALLEDAAKTEESSRIPDYDDEMGDENSSTEAL